MRRTLTATGAGNAVEWYDWAIYATFASYIASALFSAADPTSAFLQTLAIFAVGFVARPIGGWLFGMMGDRVGRKQAMLTAVSLGAVGSTIIGLVPSYASIGAWASAILVLARILQGLAHGGELPSAQTYLSEIAPKEKRGLFSSLIYFSGTIGTIMGVLLGAILSSALNKADMGAWGWRIPFLLGGVLGLITVILRSRMEESEVFEDHKAAAEESGAEKIGTLAAMKAHWREALTIIGLTVGLTVAYYVWSISMPAYAIKVVGVDAKAALWAGVIANVVMIIVLPFWGRLSDRIGRRPVLVIAGVGAAVMTLPMAALIGTGQMWALTVATSVMLVFVAASASIVPAVYAELLPTATRTLGVAIPYAVCVALFGGTAPFLQAAMRDWFGHAGGTVFNGYSVLLLLISAFVSWRIAETRGKDLAHA